MKNYSKTKIIATIGPSSWDAPVLKEMYSAGMDIARINASFADFAELERVSNTLRTTSPRIGIMLDTQGHKIRVTGLEHEIQIEGEISIPNTFDITYPDLYKDVSVGTRILLDDGNIQLVVKAIQDIEVICTVIQPGILKPNKTVNIPDVNLNFPAITEKDKADILFAVEHRFDFLSLSFVRNREDILTVRELIGDSNIKLIAKIENVQGVENFDEILAATDAIMIARGDLGIEIPFEKVPILQKQFIYKCRQAGKPVIVATQMLESMKESIQPTRAEISDVANAVMDGTDALMLSAETSTGRNPVVAVATMQKIAKEAESVLQQSPIYGHTSAPLEVDELCRNLCDISESMKLKGIVVISNTGQTVLSLSRHRPNAPIWEISSSLEQIRHDSLLNGVTGFFLKDLPQDRDECTQHAVEVVYAQGELDLNDKVAIISGSSIRHNTTDAILEIVQVKNVLSR
ncbi:MAG: Pyruvate kinase [candidate division WS6 bacterium GW2011_GWC1_36_11]|uniref:Pyruvate kinase n=1 Tax=candidate division WS6 bacterium GW2011_GWC1_36_11 TaxID=1619090 RepID=A0A0G0FZM1_9BACT|nr:MAG: Pyruvate kinase [candidate division WS6 bacterium GW2011_GWC1_36_11]KKQ11239.1 MAG: Pyruvate kinase [candidate division WS6 bacterium GW2011_GWE1_36_69]HAM96385.1 pyruvate kinase [Patescibacteria group bacterium]